MQNNIFLGHKQIFFINALITRGYTVVVRAFFHIYKEIGIMISKKIVKPPQKPMYILMESSLYQRLHRKSKEDRYSKKKIVELALERYFDEKTT